MITPSMKVSMRKVGSRASEPLSGTMALSTWASFITTIFMAWACTSGQTKEFMKDTGALIGCTEKAHSCGLMADGISASMQTIRKKASVSSSGPTGEAIAVSGSTVASMAKALTFLAMALLSMASGEMVREFAG